MGKGEKLVITSIIGLIICAVFAACMILCGPAWGQEAKPELGAPIVKPQLPPAPDIRLPPEVTYQATEVRGQASVPYDLVGSGFVFRPVKNISVVCQEFNTGRFTLWLNTEGNRSVRLQGAYNLNMGEEVVICQLKGNALMSHLVPDSRVYMSMVATVCFKDRKPYAVFYNEVMVPTPKFDLHIAKEKTKELMDDATEKQDENALRHAIRLNHMVYTMMIEGQFVSQASGHNIFNINVQTQPDRFSGQPQNTSAVQDDEPAAPMQEFERFDPPALPVVLDTLTSTSISGEVMGLPANRYELPKKFEPVDATITIMQKGGDIRNPIIHFDAMLEKNMSPVTHTFVELEAKISEMSSGDIIGIQQYEEILFGLPIRVATEVRMFGWRHMGGSRVTVIYTQTLACDPINLKLVKDQLASSDVKPTWYGFLQEFDDQGFLVTCMRATFNGPSITNAPTEDSK